MKIPDGGRPINVGDNSFIYKGVYHPIVWFGNEPYRPRVEMLVIKDARKVFLRLKDDIDKTPPNKRDYMYRIPGGSLDADSSHIEQAIAETNEEALIDVNLCYHTGVEYYSRYEPGFLLKGGDMPLEYVGSITGVYIGVYSGSYDKSKVEEKDLDNDMAENGKFYDIEQVAKYLRKEHIQALLSSQFVSTDIKAKLQLERHDVVNESVDGKTSPIIVPCGKLYHGTTCEIDLFKPMSLDLGNSFEKPGWSTFCFDNEDSAKLFGASRSLTNMLKDSANSDIDTTELNVVFAGDHLVISKPCYQFIIDSDLLDINTTIYVYEIDATGLDVGIGNDSALKEYTFRESGIKPTRTIKITDVSFSNIKNLVDVLDGSISEYNPPVRNEYNVLLSHDYQDEVRVRDFLQNAISSGDLKPGDDIEEYLSSHGEDFDSDDIHIPDLVLDADNPVLESFSFGDIVLEKDEFPEDCYGLPKRKAYPMPDEKHVRSAIKFFNYAKRKEERELADNINRFIRKYKIKDLNVGKNNRFKKYYKPITETYSLQDYLNTLQQTVDITKDKNKSPEEIYNAYGKSANVCRMMITQISAGVFDDTFKYESEKDKIMEALYAALAEIAMNQVESLSLMEAKEVRTLNIKPIMEADDDDDEDEEEDDDTDDEDSEDEEPETATDYNAMVDEEGAEDDESNEDEESDENTEGTDDDTPDSDEDDVTGGDGGDEGAIDYTTMADDEGAELDEPKTPSDDTLETTDEGEDEPPEETDTSEDDGTTEEPDDDMGDEGSDDGEEATDYNAMADDEENSEAVSDDNSDDYSSSDDETSDDTSEEDNENENRYNNKEIKNYFLLNSFLSMHQTVSDVLDSVNGVILPTPEANSMMAKVVKNLQNVKSFIEKFVQFQFSEGDYAFNLYYYNIIISVLRMNLKLFETAVSIGDKDAKIKDKRRINKS